MGELIDDVKAFTNFFTSRLESMKDDLLLIKRALGSISGGLDSCIVRVPEPHVFDGQHNLKVVENFLWDMEQYFEAAHTHEKDRAAVCTMFLAGDAKLWWRMRVVDNSRPKVSS
ncbi:hypothetical protein AMTRI_Chr06g172330 [Amborella trichopoda]